MTQENADAHARTLCAHGAVADEAAYTKDLPVLMYHDLLAQDDGTGAMTAKIFDEQMRSLQSAGYTEIDDRIGQVLRTGESFYVSPRQSDRISESVADMLADAIDRLCLNERKG